MAWSERERACQVSCDDAKQVAKLTREDVVSDKMICCS
jgi:hypothetical protein